MESQFNTTKSQSARKFDQEACKFCMQAIFSTIVLGLCVFQIGSIRDKENIALYWGGLSSVLAYWLPSPGQTKNNKEGTETTISQGAMAIAGSNGNGHSSSLTTLAQGSDTTVTTKPTEG
jgi:hypothetical protein